MRRSLRLTMVLAAVPFSAASAQPLTARLYDAATETGLPHLEENLRYATTHARLCLGGGQFATAFPLLQHVALKGCRLDHEERAASRIRYTLSCEHGSETTGIALWQIDENGIVGTLDVKLGGKNMTVYQRITGRRVGDCVPPG